MRLTAIMIFLAYAIAAICLGTFCVNYDLAHTLHRTVPTGWAFLLNLVTGGLSITLAIVLKVLIITGVIKG